MTSFKKHNVLRWVFALALVAGSACGDDDSGNGGTGGSGGSAGMSGQGGKGGAGGGGGSGGVGGKGGSGGSTSDDDDASVAAFKAADLRVSLDLYLGEHLTLAAKTTGAALANHEEESAAYLDLLNKNGTDIGALIGQALGATAQNAFDQLWGAHNGYYVEYTKAVAAKNDADKQAAVAKLNDQFVPQFSTLLSAGVGLDKGDVMTMVATHVMQAAAIVDAQAAALQSQTREDWDKVYAEYRTAFAHMFTVGDAVSEGLVQKMPSVFEGDVKSNAIELRVGLNQKLQEHLYLATFATAGILGDRAQDANAANAALGKNGSEIGDVIKTLYDAEAQTMFTTLWASHNAYFVDYANGVKDGDETKKNDAVNNLKTKYVPDFAAFLHTATDISVDDLKKGLQDHVNDTAAVVDAQHGGSAKADAAAQADRKAAQHMQMLADPLAEAIAKKKNIK